MSGSVTVPAWVAILVGIAAAWAVYDRIMAPGVRWYLRSRANRVLDEVGSRLKLEIRPFQRTRRQALIDVLVYDDRVQEAAAAYAREHDMPRDVVTERIREYAREIVPAFNAYFYFRIGNRLGRWVARSLYRVRVGRSDDGAFARVSGESTVVFVMNHRSNMDYILAAFLVADHAALSYAVGEWARVWPLQQLIRSMGAYFVRRNSRDTLYRKVLERYIVKATEAGVAQALYPEGGLTRDGTMRAPRLGALDYMVRGFHPEGDRDLVFVPLAINYDRVLEDRTLLAALEADAPRPGKVHAATTTLGFIRRQAVLMARSKWHNFGYACVNFGAPVSMREYVARRGIDFRRLDKDERFARIGEFADHLMGEVARLVPVLPVPLVATVFVRNPDAVLSGIEIKSRVEALAERLEAAGAHVYVPRRDRDFAVTAGLQMLTLRRLVDESDGLYSARPSQLRVLQYYANSIAHLVD
ncbi:MAG: glycerol-3-phosphate acyltransferase [Gammaproteobacteria bacterium]|nr:glycerol-3-phosphate acyltransferase [Gammaproteobacteria bacterium]